MTDCYCEYLMMVGKAMLLFGFGVFIYLVCAGVAHLKHGFVKKL